MRRTILELPTLQITEGFWERAGLLRAKLLANSRRANLADTLIAQSCLDHHATLVTRDRDFKNFVSLAGLRVAFPFA
ncbi:MAG TPA: PIN domain-containing protein [Nitrospira sp.]|nr:PIN domain-containing protein [Nitrospira sp.]